MPDQTTRWLLLSFGLGNLLVAAAILFAARSIPVAAVTSQVQVNQPSSVEVKKPVPKKKWQEDDFRSIWKKPLRGPLQDAAPEPRPKSRPEKKAKPTVTRAKIKVNAKLVGTLVDGQPDLARAWIDVKGKSQMVKIGSVLEGHPGNPTVEAIEDKHVTLKIGETSHQLLLRELGLGTSGNAKPWETSSAN